MDRNALEKRRGELQASLAQMQQAQTLLRGALLEVENWLAQDVAEKGAVVADTSAPLTQATEATADGGSDQSGSD